MNRLQVKRQLDEDDVAAVTDLLDAAARADGRRPLSDHLYLDLIAGGREGFGAVLAPSDSGRLGAYAQVSRANESSSFELVIHPDERSALEAIGPAMIGSAADIVASSGGGALNWWVFEPTEAHRRLAAGAGMRVGRTLFKMSRPLPTGMDVTVHTRAFVPGDDDEAWLAVNNRAFADHGEQGGWGRETLEQRIGEAWFDPEGFRLHERDEQLAAFCWTKVHAATQLGGEPDTQPAAQPEGEIYVIAVDPAFHGLGLGKQLTLAGLEHLSGRGITTAVLYVDADNTTALGLYERLGFEVAATNVAFVTDIEASQSHAPGQAALADTATGDVR